MARHLTKVYCRIRYADGSEGSGYSFLCRDGGWDIGHEGRQATVKFINGMFEVQVEGDTFTAIICKRTWRKLAKKDVPRIIRCEHNDANFNPAI